MSQMTSFSEQILDLVPNGLVVIDRNWQIITWNPEMIRLSGYSTQEVRGHSLFELFPELRGGMRELWPQLMECGKLQRLEVDLRHRNGHLIPLEVSSALLRDDAGRPVAVTFLVQDVSAQKRRDALLTALHDVGKAAALAHTPEQVFAALSGPLQQLGLRTIVLIQDEAGEHLVIQHASFRFEETTLLDQRMQTSLVGVSVSIAEANLYKSIRASRSPVYLDHGADILENSAARAFRQSLEDGGVQLAPLGRCVIAPLWRDDQIIGEILVEGDVYPEDTAAMGVFAHQLSNALANAYLWERLEERVAERTIKLQAEQERLSAILVHMADAVIFTDADEQIVYVNPAWERLNGYHLSEVLGQTPRILQSKQTPTVTLASIRQAIAQGKRWHGELYNRRKDGSIYETEITIVPVVDDSNKVIHYVGVNSDITEKKRFLRSKDQFVADMSHELRTPLTNIKFYLSLLERGDPTRTAKYMETLKREANRLHSIMEHLLSLSQLDQDRVEFTLETTDLNAFLLDLVEQQKSVAQKKGIELGFDAQSSLPSVNIDPHHMGQALLQLLLNALNYTLEGGTINIETRAETVGKTSWIRIGVTDTGLGIDPEDQERLFERFFRGQASRTTNTPGTGLGLSLCYEIIRRHGGRIDVTSRPEQGSAFIVYLPVAS